MNKSKNVLITSDSKGTNHPINFMSIEEDKINSKLIQFD